MATNWTYPPEYVAAVVDSWKAFRNRYEVACDGYTISVDGVEMELTEDQKTALRADVVQRWQAFKNAVTTLEDYATGRL